MVAGSFHGVGPTTEFNLRVSAATLSRVTFSVPDRAETLLALEHVATVLSNPSDPEVRVRAQPFGGAVRLLDPSWLHETAGGFHFDSERSRSEGDFRVFIRDSSCSRVLRHCREELMRAESGVIDADPTRELVEEFVDSLGFQLQPRQYSLQFKGLVLEDQPTATESVRAPGQPTVRLYTIHNVIIDDDNLCRLLARLQGRQSTVALRKATLDDVKAGGRGRANGILVLPLAKVRDAYQALSPQERGEPMGLAGTVLDGNVPAILDHLSVAKYERIPVAE